MRLNGACLFVGLLLAGAAAAADVGGDPPATSDAAPESSQPVPAHSAKASNDLPTVQVPGHIPDWDRKKYRGLLHAMKIFEESREVRAPRAAMRFKVFPRHDEAVMQGLTLTLWGKTVKRPIPLAADGTFVVDIDPTAREEDAFVVSNRPDGSLAWRADIRTPGLAPNTRRLGDLRLECKVDAAGTGSDLATSLKLPGFWAIVAVGDDPCRVRSISYAWFTDEPVFSVTLVAGSRRRTLPCVSVYACHTPAIFNWMDWGDHLRDRVISMPIWDTSWSDDTLVVFDPMRGTDTTARSDVQP
jgi:hypothetical protein